MKRNNVCPICGKFQFVQKYFDSNNIEQDNTFDCPVCGGELSYSILCEMNGDKFGKEYIAVYADTELI